MKTTLSLAAMAVAVALLALPPTTQASALKLDGMYQDSAVHLVASKKKKKKSIKKKKKKKYAKKSKKSKKKKAMKSKPAAVKK